MLHKVEATSTFGSKIIASIGCKFPPISTRVHTSSNNMAVEEVVSCYPCQMQRLLCKVKIYEQRKLEDVRILEMCFMICVIRAKPYKLLREWAFVFLSKILKKWRRVMFLEL